MDRRIFVPLCGNNAVLCHCLAIIFLFSGINTQKNTSAIALFMLNDCSEGLCLKLWVTLSKRERDASFNVHTCIHPVCFVSILCAGSVPNAKPACVSF